MEPDPDGGLRNQFAAGAADRGLDLEPLVGGGEMDDLSVDRQDIAGKS
jgi:hypothetical protein